MTLDRLRPVANRAIAPFVAAAERVGVSANAITIVSVGTAAGGGYALVLGGSEPAWYGVAAVLVLLTGFLDVLDGAVARATDTASDFGDFLDHVLDRYGDVMVLGGLAVGVGQHGLGILAVSGVLLTAYLGTQGDALGLGRIYGGLLGRADILVIVGVVAAVATVTNPAVYGFTLVEWSVVFFAVFTHVTALQRFVWSWRELRADG
ncbi:CDP-alcohol phosphatidyltransferase family protein [Halorubrum sp. JWXQ-INN 858]|uniref:CDP-alcohol phosphatidyltransferase family protein n=1 Tax=Halorubrum sp. JWXQ-INN 858 TaxID=2690782 RepID=UPI00135B2E78|nr:CDP-alcohol phosphatidyltransferase family protein [Halorubrum sp. JWXQ-INN 858]MWV65279.1 CDP-alcohol phosphatidyltransferase family protein [Halorubrum sp. JWXQ-INN 858]